MTTLNLKTSRFGEIEYAPEDVVHFADGLLGFPAAVDFVFIQHKEDSPFRWMQSLQDGALAFLVVDPSTYVPNYGPDMPVSAAETLKLGEDTPQLVYTIATIPPGRPEDMTLNLAGPIVVNCADRIAMQIVLGDESYPVRHRVFQKKSGSGQAA